MAQPGRKIVIVGRWRDPEKHRYFWEIAIVFFFFAFSPHFAPGRANAGGAAIFKPNAAVLLKQMWLSHTYSGMHAHTYTNCAP